MYHSGIGGGGFALVRDADGNHEAVDFRESAPAAAWEDMYKDRHRDSVAGGLAVAVPGEVRGLEYLHKKYGVSLKNGKIIKHINSRANILQGSSMEQGNARSDSCCPEWIQRYVASTQAPRKTPTYARDSQR